MKVPSAKSGDNQEEDQPSEKLTVLALLKALPPVLTSAAGVIAALATLVTLMVR